MEDPIQIEDYNGSWPGAFQLIREKLWPAVKDLAAGIEHVGSTSVPGLAAKPVIDLDIIAPKASVPAVIRRLQDLGYGHLGCLGIEGREALRQPEGPIGHHLYVCEEGCLALRNHLVFRDHLRKNPKAREAYSSLKKDLALRFGHSRDEYTQKKTGYILSVLGAEGLGPENLAAIQAMNEGRKTG